MSHINPYFFGALLVCGVFELLMLLVSRQRRTAAPRRSPTLRRRLQEWLRLGYPDRSGSRARNPWKS